MNAKTHELMNRLLNDGIKPHARSIAELGLYGRFACIVFEPGPTARTILHTLNRSLDRPIFALSAGEVVALARTDHVAARWFASPPDRTKQKIFVFVHEGTLLMNHEPRRGYSLEPGSTEPWN